VRFVALASLALAALAAAGCMPSQRLAPGDMDRLVALRAPLPADTPVHNPVLGDLQLPGTWTIREERSVILSTISLVRTADRLKKGATDVEFSVSPTHARALADLVAEARTALERLAEVVESDSSRDRKAWARGMADALAHVETIARLTDPEEAARVPGGEEPGAIAAGPLLRMLAVYLDERTGGRLMAGMGGDEDGRLREILAQIVLRVGFAAAGKEPPGGLRQNLVDAMRSAREMVPLTDLLAGRLSTAIDAAPEAPVGSGLSKIVGHVLVFAPKAMAMMEAFIRQWDRMDAVRVRLLREGDEFFVELTLHVKPGREVRLDDVIALAPVMALRGSTQIVIRPSLPGTDETVVTFDPAGDGGAAEMRFEGFVYGLARALVMPLESGALREIRVFAKSRNTGPQVVNVAVVMESLKSGGDPRRMLTVQEVTDKRLRRDPFKVTVETLHKEQVFNYVTPDRRYFYRRTQDGGS
jgi:hypothetical protein